MFVGIYRGIGSFPGFSGGAKWISSIHNISTTISLEGPLDFLGPVQTPAEKRAATRFVKKRPHDKHIQDGNSSSKHPEAKWKCINADLAIDVCKVTN